MGPETFPSGYAGVALVNNEGQIVEVIGEVAKSRLENGYMWLSADILRCKVSKNIARGQYELRAIIKARDENDFKIITRTRDCSNIIDFAVKADATDKIITATTGVGGTIVPSGVVVLPFDGSQTFTITPSVGYLVSQVLIDGENNPEAVENSSYTFENVITDQTISVLFALDTNITYTVTFVNWNNDEIYTQTVNNGSLVTAPADPVRSGYTFEGWYLELEFENKWDFNNNIVTKDIKLYAKFTLMVNAEVLWITEMSVYPNPFVNTLYLTGAEGCLMRIFTINGNVIFVMKINNFTEIINLEHLPSGMYLLNLEKEGLSKMFKIVKQ